LVNEIKIKEVDGTGGMFISQLIEMTCKVYSNREIKNEKKKEAKMNLQASLLVAAIVDKRNGVRRRGRGECGERRRGPGTGSGYGA